MFSLKPSLKRSLIFLSFYLLLIPHTLAFHGYNKSHVGPPHCPEHSSKTKPYSSEFIDRLRLWPNLMRQEDLENGETLYGSEEMLEIIWNNQNPKNCSEAKFLISGGWPYGFGSRIHMEGLGLGIALQMGRVYLDHPDGDNIFWETSNTYCNNPEHYDQTMKCFYQPFSSRCTMADAIRNTGDVNQLATVFLSTFKEAFESAEGLRKTIEKFDGHTGLNIIYTYDTSTTASNGYDTSNYIPHKSHSILECAPLKHLARFQWWRTISATFVVRPNRYTLQQLTKYSTVPIEDFNECIAIFVRHGDKGMEMKLLDFDAYRETAEFMWQHGMLPQARQTASIDRSVPSDSRTSSTDSSRIDGGFDRGTNSHLFGANLVNVSDYNGTLFITTDDQAVLDKAHSWGQPFNWRIMHTNLFDRTKVTASKTWAEMLKETAATHDNLEYFSMVLNLQYALMCEGWICTIASNSCRIMDELRTTVGGKANRYFADLSGESCESPPCFEEGVVKYES